ncbi:MAG: phosphotransferase [Terriglobales bacterium]
MAVNGDGKWVLRQSDGAKIGREVLGALGPEVIEVSQARMITARLPGHPNTPWEVAEETNLQAAILAAVEPLKQIYDSGHWTGHADDELINTLQGYVRQSSRQVQLQAGLDLIKQWDRSHVRTVRVHGDYWLKNILFSEGRVTGVVDWDRARLNGCAGIDALHLAFMSYAMWSNIPVSELLADVCTEHWHFPWLSSYCAFIRKAFSLCADDLKYLAILLWLSYFFFYDELHVEVQPDHNSGDADWYAQMISPMREAIIVLQRELPLGGVE